MRLVHVLIAGLVSLPAYAQDMTASDYIQAGDKSWAALECAALSAGAGDATEQSRLFSIGYEKGTLLVYGWKTGQLSEDDVSGLNWNVLSRLKTNAKPDFILGMLWEAATSHAFAFNKSPIGSDEWKLQARASYSDRNCSRL